MSKAIHKVDILGVHVSPLTYSVTLQVVADLVAKSLKGYICVAAVHLVMECQKDPKLLAGVNNATVVTPDGMPLVWLILRSGQKTERVYGPDLMLKICEKAARENYKIFLLGGNIGQSQLLKKKLTKKYSKLNIAGIEDTPIRPLSLEQNKQVIRKINQSGAQIVFVGTGCPTQELWMIENRKKLAAAVLIGVGAAFDYICGKRKQPPKRLQKLGFEWLFRLVQEPRRLWKRYLFLNAQFLMALLGVR